LTARISSLLEMLGNSAVPPERYERQTHGSCTTRNLRPEMNTRIVLATVLRAAVTIALLAWVLSHDEVREGLRTTKFQKPWLLVASLVCAAGAAFVATVRWRYCMKVCDCELPFATALRISLAGDAAGLLSVGPLGVDAVRIGLGAKQLPDKKAALVTSVALDHLSALPVMIALGLAILATLGASPELNRISAIVVAASVVAFFGAGLTLRAVRRELHDRILAYVKQRVFSRGAAYAALISVPLVALHFGIFWFAAAALPLEAPPFGLLGAIIVADTIAALPISIGGLGVREKSFELLLHNWYAVSPALAIKASLAGVTMLALWAVAGAAFMPFRRTTEPKEP
jgi:glycosyltransferase 2 family protein